MSSTDSDFEGSDAGNGPMFMDYTELYDLFTTQARMELLDKEIIRHKMVSFLTMKGGSGKTTMAWNFSNMIQSVHHPIFVSTFKKVLLLDCDPQMNITCATLSNEQFDSYVEEVEESLGHMYGGDIQGAQETSTSFRGFWYHQNQLNEVTKSTVKQVLEHCDEEKKFTYINRVSRGAGSYIDTMNGGFDMDLLEDLSGQDTSKTNNFRRLNKVMGHLKEIYDLIVIDMNPSMSNLNRSMFGVTDYVCSVVTPDRFSCTNFTLISKSFYAWYNAFERRVSERPVYAGYIVNKVKSRVLKKTTTQRQLQLHAKKQKLNHQMKTDDSNEMIDRLETWKNKYDETKESELLGLIDEGASTAVKKHQGTGRMPYYAHNFGGERIINMFGMSDDEKIALFNDTAVKDTMIALEMWYAFYRLLDVMHRTEAAKAAEAEAEEAAQANIAAAAADMDVDTDSDA